VGLGCTGTVTGTVRDKICLYWLFTNGKQLVMLKKIRHVSCVPTHVVGR